MTNGHKSNNSDKQKRQVVHVEDSYLETQKDKADEISRTTVHKQDGGGKKPGRIGRKPATRKPVSQRDEGNAPKQPRKKGKPAKATGRSGQD